MNKKFFLYALTAMMSCVCFAQDVDYDDGFVFDEKEDTTDVVTVKSIVKMKQDVVRRTDEQTHIKKVWSRKSFLNISWNPERLKPLAMLDKKNNQLLDYVPVTKDENGNLYYNNGKAPVYKADWGIAITNGSNFRLHKRAIANVLTFNLDFSWIDLGVTHFKDEKNNLPTIDNTEYTLKDGTSERKYYFVPYNAEKYEFNFGMKIGPSITVAPFTYVDVRELQFLKLNVYFHVGYNVSLLLMNNKNDELADGNGNKGASLNLGHGIYTAVGMGISWKSIGIGFEKRNTTYKYQSIGAKNYLDNHYKFNNSAMRVYLQYRF